MTKKELEAKVEELETQLAQKPPIPQRVAYGFVVAEGVAVYSTKEGIEIIKGLMAK